MADSPGIIAHRGVARHYPENTRRAFDAAVEAGADAVEMDIQLTADAVPVVLHDPFLDRTTDYRGDISALTAAELGGVSAHEPRRFGERFRGEQVPELASLAEHLANLPFSKVFIEIKTELLWHHSIPLAVQVVLAASQPLGERRVIISFSDTVLQVARSQADVAVGWVLPGYGVAMIERAETLAPEFLFCNHHRLPPEPSALPRGSWQWAAYEVDTPTLGRRLARRGIDWLESMCPEELRRGLLQGR
ncbi:glycerophosphodiester phosphodiesterase family protein [Aquisalimonas sp.]|uniref:glycerophosphodiester phosphodiesterase family protein n=1 Tax=Aquisalimonas sp. TaxID=1872621 RepID=UPI0025C23848|nr:glycerophosphodiester phosphodiesterase family protein [Aquisalimonas sp.]